MDDPPPARPERLAVRLRGAVRRLLGVAPSDWAGPDASRLMRLEDERTAPERPFDVVRLGGTAAPALDDALADANHRVYRISRAADGPSPYTLGRSAPGRSDVALRAASDAAAFDALDALRRDEGLGATAVVLGDASWNALAARLGAERAWAVAAAPGPAEGDPAGVLARAFPRISVAIVTHQNREMNRLCVESVLARTEWPSLEVIAADNGSTDGTRGLLEDAAGRDSRLSLLAFDENRGFPAACNAALARARGDFLVLLNNDTVVTRGWATALVRHLVADASLGLVGPVTNAIANAARIATGYRRLADLPAWAADWTRAHDGETSDIGSLAFFCVAMRRETWERIGPLDERFGVGMFEDGDYCRRVRAAGLGIRCARDAFVHHWQMASFRRMSREAYTALYESNRRLFEEKWGPTASATP